MTDAPTPFRLRDFQRATLKALIQTILPHLFENGSDGYDMPELVEERIGKAPPNIRSDLTQALDVFGGRLGGLLITGRPTAFYRHPARTRQRIFGAWGVSAIPLARSVHQALRRLVLTTWYATDGARTELGLHPPLHTRRPRVSWEGPLPGDRTLDEEPVARQRDRDSVPGAEPAPRAVPPAVTLPDGATGDVNLTCDVVVIGSGAGGAVAAARFAEAGREVIVLEEGEWVDAPEFNELEGPMVPRLFAEQAMRTTGDASITLLQGGAVGGGTTVNWMMSLRPGDDVLDEWSSVVGLRGFSMKDLAPHFDRVGEEIHARTPPADAHSPSNLAIFDGAKALGWVAKPGMINARGCVQAGTCALGCRYEAKQSTLVTYLPRAFAAGARLYTGATVERIELMERDRPNGTPSRKRVHATIRRPGSRDVRARLAIDAPVVVLAAGAVATPVILERSGLGGGGVGRFLRLHPTTAVLGLHARETYPLSGIPQTALCDEFIRRDANGYGFWIESASFQPSLASAAMPGFGEQHRRHMQLVKYSIPLIVLVRDGSGTVESMGSVTVSRSGRVRIRHTLTPYDRVNLRQGIEAAARMQLAAGAREALSLHTPMLRATDEAGLSAMGAAPVSPNRVGLFSAHVNGTCRLGVDPENSGCSPSGERHGVRGLYVMDGSLLPTAPGVNPQWTIMALASLLAERAL